MALWLHGCVPRRALSVLFLAVSLLVALLAGPVRADSPPATAPSAAAPKRSTAALQAAVDGLQGWVQGHGGRLGAAVQDTGSGRMLAAAGERQALNPASNAKLLTAAVALAELGPDFRYTTGLYGRLDGGTVKGLVLRGHGDPSLSLEDLWLLAHAAVSSGLERVDGILVDQSRFDEQFVPPAFGQQPDEWAAFRAPVSAVALEQNSVTMNVVALQAGKPARVWFDPPGFVKVVGTVRTRAAGKGQSVRLTLKKAGSRLEAVVGGHVAEGLPRLRFRRRVDDPRRMAGYVLSHLLREQGVKVTGEVELGGHDQTHQLVFHRSAPLSSLLGRVGKRSDNFYAEMIMKTLGAEAAGEPATSAAGASVVEGWLKSVDAWGPGARIVNGSGLFDANRVSAQSFVRALTAARNDPRMAPEFIAQLAVGGNDGTLGSRFRNHKKQRLVRAKTGTLAKVVALSGYVLSPRGEAPVAFSLIITGLSAHAESRRRMDAVVERLVAWQTSR